jgi:hypothetical protein
MNAFELNEVLSFLAQPHDDLQLYVPEYEEHLHYRCLDEDGFYVDDQIPSKAAGQTCIAVIDKYVSAISDVELTRLTQEIESLLLIMVDLTRQSEYHWMINKNSYMISGPNDTSWAILRRLASLALSRIGEEIRPPSIPFREFIKLGGFSSWKVVPISDSEVS